MNDRGAPKTVVRLGGESGGMPRENSFLLTAASELMAAICLAEDLGDLKDRISPIIVAYDKTTATTLFSSPFSHHGEAPLGIRHLGLSLISERIPPFRAGVNRVTRLRHPQSTAVRIPSGCY